MKFDYDVEAVDPLQHDIKQRRKAQEQAVQVEKTLQTDGWKVLESWLYNQIQFCGDKLLTEQDSKQVLRYQTACRAYYDVIGQAKNYVNVGRSLRVETDPEASEE